MCLIVYGAYYFALSIIKVRIKNTKASMSRYVTSIIKAPKIKDFKYLAAHIYTS